MRMLAPWAEQLLPLLRLPLGLLCLAALLLLLAPFEWVAELATHFSWQLLITACASTLALLACGRHEARRPMLLASLASLSIFAYPVVRAYAPAPPAAARADGAPAPAPLRVLHFNAHTANTNKARAVAGILLADADIVVVQEVNEAWLGALSRGLSGYRVLAAEPRSDNFGMVAFAHARVEQARAQVHQDAWEMGVPTIEVELAGLRLLAVHTLPPISTNYAQRRNAQLEGIAAWSQTHTGTPRVVVGDLNVSVFSPHFRALQTDAELVDARRSARVFAWPTFPAGLLGWVVGIPIDHALLSPQLRANGFEVADDWGSDHRAVIVSVHPTR